LDRGVAVCTEGSQEDPGMVLGYWESPDTWTEGWLCVLRDPRKIPGWSINRQRGG
jgi:hypothetical protein